MTSPTPYQVLGVSQDAHDDEMKAAYRKQSLLHHPDKHPNDATIATERMKEINEAWEKLKPENRAATDEALGKTSSSRAQAPEHQRQRSRSPFAQRAGSHQAGDDFWWQNWYYGRQWREHQREEAERQKEANARAWSDERAERDQRESAARERKRQREREKALKFWQQMREQSKREQRQREEEERLRRQEEEESARKRQEEADRLREAQERLQRDLESLAEQERRRQRAAEDEARRLLEESYQRDVEREIARQKWEREQMQSAQFIELYQRHDAVYNEWLQLEAEYNNLLPLVRLDLSGPDLLARYIARSVMDTQDGLCMEVHPYRTEWITLMDHSSEAWPIIYSHGKSGLDIGRLLDDARTIIEQLEGYMRKLLIIFKTLKQEDMNTRQQHDHPQEQGIHCHYLGNEAANIAIAKAMHRDIRRRVEVFNLSTWDRRVVEEVAREWAPEFRTGICKAQKSRSLGCLLPNLQVEVQLALVRWCRLCWKRS